jgi:D-sedoheptulose 7-phosphate isomerase
VHSIDQHFADHLNVIEALRAQRPVIEKIGEMIVDCLRRSGCVFWLGNGGSTADCQHLAAELVGRFERDRSGLASVALTTDTSALTSIANDYGFEQVFARQVEALCRPGDLVIGISTSGNSPMCWRPSRPQNAMESPPRV